MAPDDKSTGAAFAIRNLHNATTSSLCSATTYSDKVALPALAHRMLAMQRSIKISCLPGPQQQKCSSGFAAVGPSWYKETD